jgi:hypothetical protein
MVSSPIGALVMLQLGALLLLRSLRQFLRSLGVLASFPSLALAPYPRVAFSTQRAKPANLSRATSSIGSRASPGGPS